jgi:hypothetical protein
VARFGNTVRVEVSLLQFKQGPTYEEEKRWEEEDGDDDDDYDDDDDDDDDDENVIVVHNDDDVDDDRALTWCFVLCAVAGQLPGARGAAREARVAAALPPQVNDWLLSR